ncbi:hypothetical protein K438DRAFT_1590126 [Mycena galopus ATCC 62051]|nr:hypothetical protein K438DRAFT_1590126 [Mycena galopus ATCC 62051]
MAVSLLSASPEVLRDIVLYAARSALGPPQEWYSLVLCCQALRRQLDTPAMHVLLFATKFHVPADVFHLLPAHAKTELQRRFSALKFFRRGEQCLDDHESFRDALWVSYLMLRAEEPRQMNVDQLSWAGLPHLLLVFLKQRLNDGAEENHGWPLANDTNSLTIALMWLLSSESSVRAESPATRDAVMERIRPYVLAAFRYPLSSLRGDYCGPLESPLTTINITKSSTVHGAYPAPAPPCRKVWYFGPRTVQVPSASIYSTLCYFTRLDTQVPVFPVHLASSAPAQTPPSGTGTGPRREDVEHWVKECRTRFEPWDLNFATAYGLNVNDTLTRYLGQSYVPGSLTGRWQGSSIVPCLNSYRHWLNELEAPETMDTLCRQPLYITLQEYVYCAEKPILSGLCYMKQQADAWVPSSWDEKGVSIFVAMQHVK